MYDHIGIHVKDLAASTAFYKAVLAPLGHVLNSSDDSGAGLGPKGASSLWLYPSKAAKGPGSHIAFAARDRKSVDQFHAAGLKAGGKDNGGAVKHRRPPSGVGCRDGPGPAVPGSTKRFHPA